MNLAGAEGMAPGLNSVFAEAAELAVDVETPSGQTVTLDDPALVRMLHDGVSGAPELALVRSDKPDDGLLAEGPVSRIVGASAMELQTVSFSFAGDL